MKKLFVGILLFISFNLVNAQDKVTLKDGRELSVYIIEKNDTEIIYRNANSTGHTIFSTKLTNLKTIQYENGDVDLLSSMNPRSLFPLGISAGISLAAFEDDGDGMFTGGIDYLFTPNLSAEINIGSGGESDLYYSFGGKYWLVNKYSTSGFSPFTGLLYGEQYGINFWEVPAGVSYITRFGFQTSFHLSYIRYINGWVNYDTSKLNAELRIGWRFK